MPIIDVEIVLPANEALKDDLASELADELGAVFDSDKGNTWVKVRGLPAGQYAEDGGREDGEYPVFVSIVKAILPDNATLREEIRVVTGTVAQVCGRSSSLVHITYEPPGSGRVAFGGKLVS